MTPLIAEQLAELKGLHSWDFIETESVPDGYDWTQKPKMSDDNFRILVEEHNKLVIVVTNLIEHLS